MARKEADKATIEAAQRAAAPLAVAAEIDVAEKAKTEAIKIAEAASARANAVYNPPDSQTPQWSDLLINETRLVDGTVTREIDVARFQMLLFILITAVFVLLSVLTTYAIPEIPTGFLTLMGISNGVYLGAKVAQGP